MIAWMVFYVAWQIGRARTTTLRIVYSSVYSMSAAFLAWGFFLRYFFGGEVTLGDSIPWEMTHAEAWAWPSIILGGTILFAMIVLEVTIHRRGEKRLKNGCSM